MFSSVQETTSDKGKSSTMDGNGQSASRNSNKLVSKTLKYGNKTMTLKKSATQSKLMSNDNISLTTREPESDVLELK